jgi:hypothetical protein
MLIEEAATDAGITQTEVHTQENEIRPFVPSAQDTVRNNWSNLVASVLPLAQG